MAVPQNEFEKKTWKYTEETFESNFFNNKHDSVRQIFDKTSILTVSELYVKEVYREVFKQLNQNHLFVSTMESVFAIIIREKTKKIYYPWFIVEQFPEPNQWTTDWERPIIAWKTMI